MAINFCPDNFIFSNILDEVSQSDLFLCSSYNGITNAKIFTDMNKKCIIATKNYRSAIAKISAEMFPHNIKNIIAVTGTNGKTSVTHYISNILQHLNKTCTICGTLGIFCADKYYANNMTTPGPYDLHKILQQCDSEFLAIEATSHGISQKRLDGLTIDTAAITYIGIDHLDYHQNMNEYILTKCSLFDNAAKNCVINADIEEYHLIKFISRGKNIITYGYNKNTDISIENNGKIRIFDKKYNINIQNKINGYNIMCAIASVLFYSNNIDIIVESANNIPTIPGRIELIYNNLFKVYIDYAHTPDAILSVLSHIHSDGRKIVVFGAGGDRDRGKRPIMGLIVKQHATIGIVTDDNPRTENPEQIRKEIINNDDFFINIGDRYSAIEHAIKIAQKDDIIFILGKGHEEVVIDGKKISDKIIAQEVLQNKKYF